MDRRTRYGLAAGLGLACLACAAAARGAESGGGGGHSDPFVSVLLELGIIVFAAMVGRWGAIRLRQPAVVGELLMGVLAGNVGYAFGLPICTFIMHLQAGGELVRTVWDSGLSVADAAQRIFSESDLAPGGVGRELLDALGKGHGGQLVVSGLSLWLFSNLGVLLLLFMVGLESSVGEMMRVGPRALSVAVVGVVAPFALGYGAGLWLLPKESAAVHLFLAATLCATSVGITARVFRDMGRLQTEEARVILGAAVIDDILGLIILAVVVGIVATGQFAFADVGRIMLASVGFMVAVIWLGDRLLDRLVPIFGGLDPLHVKLLFPLIFAFAVSAAANAIGLASIVGAFAAGLVLEEDHFGSGTASEARMHDLLTPLEAIFAPVFFVLMGMQVNLSTFADPMTVMLAGAFVITAVVGKIVAGLPAGRHRDRLTVGIGMVPRGEVGLIFASIGKGLGVVTDAVFSAVVMMVIITTLITPGALKWSVARQRRRQPARS